MTVGMRIINAVGRALIIIMNDHQSHGPLLSVIVPVYKTERYLDSCVRSVLGQTLEDLELILVDDESPDGAPEMCDAYAAADPRVKVIHKKNAGLGAARNTGLEQATGKYVAFLDSDDIIEPQTYAESVALMESRGADMVRFRCNRFLDSGECSETTYDGEPVEFDTPDDIRSLALCIFDIPSPEMDRFDLGGSSCMAVYRHDLLSRHALRFENEREYLSEDYLFNFDYYRHASKVVWLPRTYYHYRITQGSLTRKLNLGVMDRVEHYCRHVEDIFRDRGFGEADMHYASGFYVRALRANMRFVFLSKELDRAGKKKWFDERTTDPAFVRRFGSYPWRHLPLKQRILFRAMAGRHFLLCYGLIVGFSRLRKDKLK